MRPFRRSSREPKNLAVAGFETAGIFSRSRLKDGSANRELRSNGLIRVKLPSTFRVRQRKVPPCWLSAGLANQPGT